FMLSTSIERSQASVSRKYDSAMEHPRHLRIEDFTYDLPDEKIAKYPLDVRDSSKLIIYKDGSISESSYKQIASHIPADSLLVFNQTKVVHARLLFKKPTGGIIE